MQLSEGMSRGVMKAVVLAVLVFTAWDELSHLRRRVALRSSSWLERVDHEQASRLHQLELAHVFRRLEPH